MDEKTHVLIVEDETRIARFLQMELDHEGFSAEIEGNGTRAYERIIQENFDIILLDVMLPGMDGIEICRRVRTVSNVPIIMLTARDAIEDRVEGLDIGADDYITKPFAMRELLARIRSVARRSGYQVEKLELGNVTLDTGEQELIAKNCMRLGSKEARLMELFMRNPGKVLGGSELFRKVWGESEERGDDTLYLYISYLRQKLNAIQADLLIEGELGGSYVLRQRDA